MRPQTAKKRNPAVDRNESLMMIGPWRIIRVLRAEFPLLAKAARSGHRKSIVRKQPTVPGRQEEPGDSSALACASREWLPSA